MAESLVKQMTGGEKMTARFMRAEYFEFMPHFKLWVGTNHKPVIRGTDQAIWRRIVDSVQCNHTTRGTRQKPSQQTEKEMPGILNWAVMGCMDWQKRPGRTGEVIKATNDYRSEMDVLTRFVSDCCTTATQRGTKSSELYKKYAEWSKDNGEFALSQTKFSTRMQEKGFNKTRTNRGMVWEGIAIVDDDAGDDIPFK